MKVMIIPHVVYCVYETTVTCERKRLHYVFLSHVSQWLALMLNPGKFHIV